MDIQEALSEYIKTTGQSQNAVARAMGVSAASLSQYLRGKYPGDVSSLESKIASVLDLSAEREEYPRANIRFNESLSIVSRVCEIARNCHIGRAIGIVTGDSGIGKTTSVNYYVRNNPDVIVIYARPSITIKSIVQELAQDVNVNSSGSIDDIFMRIVAKLKDSGRMLVIDEAEHLTARVLDQLRRLNDPEFAGIGILLVGLPRLINILRSNQNDHKYIYSRVGWNINVTGLTDRDCKVFVEQSVPQAAQFWNTYANCSGHNTRALRNLIARSVEIACFNKALISDDLIRQTSKLLIV